MSTKNTFWIAAGLLCAAGMMSLKADLYVSATGSANDFTRQHPGPIAGLKEKIRAVKPTASGDLVVHFAKGIYFLAEPLSLTAEDGGNAKGRIIWEGSAWGEVLFSGGTQVTNWTLHDSANDIWQASVPKGFNTRQLYVNGKRATRARSPEDEDFKAIDHAYPKAFSLMNENGFTTTYELASWKNLQRVEAMMRMNWWRIARVPLASVEGNRVTFQQPGGRNAFRQEMRHVMYLENAYELLDAEGEWYLDPTVSTIYYKPRAGEDLNKATIIAGRLERLVHLKDVSGLTFRNLRFAHSTWLFPFSSFGYTTWQGGNYFHPTPQGEAMTQMPGAVQAERVCDVLFDRCIVEHVGTSGITITDGSRNVTVQGCRIDDVSGHGFEIGNALGGGHTEQIVARNNYIRDAANEFQDCHGLFVSSANDVLAEHNELHSFPYSAVAVGWGWSGRDTWYGNLKFRHNRVWDYLQKGSDGGGIYTLSSQPGSDITANYFDKNNDPGRKHDGTGHMHGGSIYLDQGSSRFTISSNVCTRTSRWLFTWADDSRNNNIQYNWSDTKEEQSVIGGKRGNIISNNTVVVNGQWPPAAKAVMAEAGLEPRFKFIKKNLADGY